MSIIEIDMLVEAFYWMQELKYVWANSRDSGDRRLLELIADINKIELLLAQPEQELVDWEKEKKSYLDEIDRLGVESNRDEEEIDRLTQLLTPTDQKPFCYILLGEYKRYFYCGRGIDTYIKSYPFDDESIPLYTSPPKRKPLSENEITKLWANKSPMNEFECVRLVEKAHDIGEIQ